MCYFAGVVGMVISRPMPMVVILYNPGNFEDAQSCWLGGWGTVLAAVEVADAGTPFSKAFLVIYL